MHSSTRNSAAIATTVFFTRFSKVIVANEWCAFCISRNGRIIIDLLIMNLAIKQEKLTNREN